MAKPQIAIFRHSSFNIPSAFVIGDSRVLDKKRGGFTPRTLGHRCYNPVTGR
jgi:hypothetical protein